MPIVAPALAFSDAERAAIEGRFWQHVRRGPDCWRWTGGSDRGYGRFRIGARMLKAPRVAYVLMVGPIPAGLVIDHLCRNPACVNPDHLELVTPAENLSRAGAAVTHCPQGHEYTAENTYRPQGRRRCKACHVERERRRRARVRREAA